MKIIVKFIVRFICFALILLILNGCTYSVQTIESEIIIGADHNNTSSQSNKYSGPTNKYGNLYYDIDDFPMAVKQGDWIYYITENAIYKEKNNGAEKTKLCAGNYKNISVAGEWVYFTSYDIRKSEVYRVKIDGTGFERFLINAYQYICVDGWVYYTRNDDYRLYKVNVNDKTQRYRLTQERLDSGFNVVNNRILWKNGQTVNVCDLNGKLISQQSYMGSLMPYNGYYYFYEYASTQRGLYKAKADGTDKQKIDFDFRYTDISNLTVYNNRIYFTHGTRGALYSINLDGSDLKVISEHRCEYPAFVGEWVYYKDYSSGEYYKVLLDGSECLKVAT